PLAFMTTDRGRTWVSIAGDLPPQGPVKVLREDVRNPNLLFAGTEFGIFASFDRGGHWTKMDGGLPTGAVDDIQIHARDFDRVIATRGRRLWVRDDIRPLEEMTRDVMSKDVHLFSLRPAREFQMLPEGARWSPRIFKGENPPFGLIINYQVKQFTGEE